MDTRRFASTMRACETASGHAPSPAPMWSHLRITRLRAEYRADGPCSLTESRGPMLRGALGFALKRMACLHDSKTCEPCPARDRCAFGAMYERGEAGADVPFDRPMPYFLTLPRDEPTQFEAGDRLALTATLVGSGRVWLPWLVAALTSIGPAGLGEHRHPFTLVRLAVEAPVGCDTELSVACAGIGQRIGELDGLSLAAVRPLRPDATLRFQTPADLRRKGRLVERPDAALLLSRLFRRLGGLLECYAGWQPEGFDFAGLLNEARAITCRSARLEERSIDRFSAGVGLKHSLSGVIGRVEMSGIPPRIWPYLVVGESIHIGKGASFGMGHYILE